MGVYSNEAAVYAASVKEAAVNPIQFAIDSYRSDMQLFEAMIERDVCNALNESGIVVLEEEQVKAVDGAAKKGIITKIKEAIEKIINWIKNAFNAFKNKILELVKADKKIWLKYGTYLENRYEEMKDCPATGATVDYEYLAKLQNAYSTCDELIETIDKIEKVEDAKEIYDKFNSWVKLDLKKMSENLKNTAEGTIIAKMGSRDHYNDMVSDIKAGYKEKLNDTKKWYDVMLKRANIKKGNIKVQMNNSDDKEEIKALHDQYTIVNMEIGMIKKFCDIAVLDVKTRIGIERSNFLVLGSWAAKKAGAAKNEAALIDEAYILEECSNQFVEEIFAWV